MTPWRWTLPASKKSVLTVSWNLECGSEVPHYLLGFSRLKKLVLCFRLTIAVPLDIVTSLEALLLRNPPPNAPTSPLFHRRFVVFVVGCLCLFSTVSVVVAFILPVVTYSFSINTRSAKLLVLAFQKKRGHQQTFLACASDKSHNCGDSNKLSTSNYTHVTLFLTTIPQNH